MKFDLLFILDIDKLSSKKVSKKDARISPVFHMTYERCDTDNLLEKISDTLSRQLIHQYESGDLDFSYSHKIISELTEDLVNFDYEYYGCDDDYLINSSTFYVVDFNNNDYIYLLKKNIKTGEYSCEEIYDNDIMESLKKETRQFKYIDPNDGFVDSFKVKSAKI